MQVDHILSVPVENSMVYHLRFLQTRVWREYRSLSCFPTLISPGIIFGSESADLQGPGPKILNSIGMT